MDLKGLILPDTVDGNGLLDHELTKKLTNLFQEYQPSVIVPALSQQSVEDLALFFLILTRLDAEIYLNEESGILVVDIAAEMFSDFSLDQQAAIAQKITTIDIVSTDQIEKTINGIINQVLDFSQNMLPLRYVFVVFAKYSPWKSPGGPWGLWGGPWGSLLFWGGYCS